MSDYKAFKVQHVEFEKDFRLLDCMRVVLLDKAAAACIGFGLWLQSMCVFSTTCVLIPTM